MELVQFTNHPECVRCPLSATCKSVGTGARLLAGDPANPKKVAVLIVGEAPGKHEDDSGQCFVGPAGRILAAVYVEASGLSKVADVYATNAVRCRPPQNAKPTGGQIKACNSYLRDDVVALETSGYMVALLCTGATATQAVLSCSLAAALSKQGTHSSVGGPVFSTYHPAYLMPGRSPSSLVAVRDHLDRLRDWVEGKGLPSTDLYAYEPGPRVAQTTPWLSYDIETYGAIRGYTQTVFHPMKSVHIDGVPIDQLIKTVSITFPRPNGTLQTYVYKWADLSTPTVIQSWMEQTQMLLGQNLLFDLQYTRFVDVGIRAHLNRRFKDQSLLLWDLSISSYLNNEGRPERSLKNMSIALGLGAYDRTTDDPFESDDDPALHRYNATDTIRTAKLHTHFVDDTLGGLPSTSKFSPYCYEWFSSMLWTAMYMAEAGVAIDQTKLERRLQLERRKQELLQRKATLQFACPLSGAGSMTGLRERLERIFQRLPAIVRVKLKRTQEGFGPISTQEENINSITEHLDGGPDHDFLKLVLAHRKSVKMAGTYLVPFLDRDSKTRLVQFPRRDDRPIGFSYPSYFIVPSSTSEYSSEQGGTQQSRWALRNPALQTVPPPIKKCFVSRFGEDGILLGGDLSQNELRAAAVLSGDPLMIQEYMEDQDRHATTAQLIFGEDIINHPQFIKKYRQGGKTLNFLTLFRGGADKFRSTIMRDFGIRIPYSVCVAAIKRFWARYRVLYLWQEELIKGVVDQKRLELPLIGQSRFFHGNEQTIRREVSTIVNLPVQAVASNVYLSGLAGVNRALRARELQSVVVLPVHDASYVDTLLSEREEVESIMQREMTDPAYYRDLCKHLGRSVPLKCDIHPHRKDWRFSCSE